ncbi:MAG: hypothetical protein ACM3O7_01750, partial [Acidobacteriota bacterium]
RMRMQEILELVLADVLRQAPSDVNFTGVVLSGGGAHLEGLAALAEEVFVKRGRLAEMEGMADATHLLDSSELPSRSPAVAVGLLAYGRRLLVPTTLPVVRAKRAKNGLIAKITRRFAAKKEREVAHDPV